MLQVAFHIESVLLIKVRQFFVPLMLGNVEFVAQEWPDSAQLQDALAAIHDRKFVPAHKLFTTMSSDEFKMGKKIPLLIMRRGIKCDIQKLDSQLLNNIA